MINSIWAFPFGSGYSLQCFVRTSQNIFAAIPNAAEKKNCAKSVRFHPYLTFKTKTNALGIAAEMACPERQAIIANSPTRRGTPKKKRRSPSFRLKLLECVALLKVIQKQKITSAIYCSFGCIRNRPPNQAPSSRKPLLGLLRQVR
jgi:hypothetical protein